MVRKSQLKEIVRFIVQETLGTMQSISAPSDVDATLAATDALTAPTPAASAAEKAKQERELRKATQTKLRATQKAAKLDHDKHRAEDKQWKIKKKAYDKTQRDLKMSL